MDAQLLQFLASTELFNQLPDEGLQALSQVVRVQRYYPNVTVFEQGGAPVGWALPADPAQISR